VVVDETTLLAAVVGLHPVAPINITMQNTQIPDIHIFFLNIIQSPAGLVWFVLPI
jgi:hypothetical protein